MLISRSLSAALSLSRFVLKPCSWLVPHDGPCLRAILHQCHDPICAGFLVPESPFKVLRNSLFKFLSAIPSNSEATDLSAFSTDAAIKAVNSGVQALCTWFEKGNCQSGAQCRHLREVETRRLLFSKTSPSVLSAVRCLDSDLFKARGCKDLSLQCTPRPFCAWGKGLRYHFFDCKKCALRSRLRCTG